MTEILVRWGNIFSYERIFPAEWDNFFLWSRCKKVLRNYSIHCDNSSIIVLFTKNLNQLFFHLDVGKEDIKVLCCLSVSNRHRTPTKHKMRIKPWYFRIKQNWTIFLQVYFTHFECWLLSKCSHLTACQNKSRPGRGIFRRWTRGNNIFFPVKRENNGKTIFIWTAPKTEFSLWVSLRYLSCNISKPPFGPSKSMASSWVLQLSGSIDLWSYFLNYNVMHLAILYHSYKKTWKTPMEVWYF